MTSTERDAALIDALNESTAPKLSEATIHDLLNDRHRRNILRYLQSHDGPIEIEAMIEHLIHQESNAYPSDTATELT